MSIIHDHKAIPAQMKGDTWWTPEKPEPSLPAIAEPQTEVKRCKADPLYFAKEFMAQQVASIAVQRQAENAAFLEGLSQSISETFGFSSKLPTGLWRQFNDDKSGERLTTIYPLQDETFIC
jgi:hypothetical protein